MTRGGRRPPKASHFGYEFSRSGETLDPALGAIAVSLADRVVSTVRNASIRTGIDTIYCTPFYRLNALQGRSIPVINCKVPGDESLPVTRAFNFDREERPLARMRRAAPEFLATNCIKGINAALRDTPFYTEKPGYVEYSSGPEPVSSAEFVKRIAGLVLPNDALPRAPGIYVREVVATSNAILAELSGPGAPLPPIVCEVRHGALYT